jgi:hypothetical protein
MTSLTQFLGFCLVALLLPLAGEAGENPDPETYVPTVAQMEKHKAFYDDPRPLLNTFGPKQVLPPELYARLTHDIDEMRKKWAEVVGFKAPDAVGSIAPEVKPGKYTYTDLAQYPGFKNLMWPNLYDRIKPGEPPFAGSIPEFEIIPTRQFYWAEPIASATKQNEGKSKLDQDGYLIPETWLGGYPFPRPSEKFKAQQIMYNIEKRHTAWSSNYYVTGHVRGFTKGLKVDRDSTLRGYGMRLAGRVVMEPYGWFDERAKQRGESKTYIYYHLSPRDVEGTVQTGLYYLDPKKADQLMMHLPSIRRVRKMSSTDNQDQMANLDQTYDDTQGFSQKLSPTRYPYTYKVIEEREYLVPAPTLDGSNFISAEGIEFRNVQMERRPLYVVELNQLDPNYVYSRRLLYIDQEMFAFYHIDNFDRKGQLYRTFDLNWSFFPEMGKLTWCGALTLSNDHLDTHSSAGYMYDIPAFCDRNDFGLKAVNRQAK